mgnify:CR=1 FL=1
MGVAKKVLAELDEVEMLWWDYWRNTDDVFKWEKDEWVENKKIEILNKYFLLQKFMIQLQIHLVQQLLCM